MVMTLNLITFIDRYKQLAFLNIVCLLVTDGNIYVAIHQLANLQFIEGMFLDDVKIIQNVTHISNCLF
jgi:hypothetical protein